jgi:hypothetical protein
VRQPYLKDLDEIIRLYNVQDWIDFEDTSPQLSQVVGQIRGIWEKKEQHCAIIGWTRFGLPTDRLTGRHVHRITPFTLSFRKGILRTYNLGHTDFTIAGKLSQ